MKRLSLLFLVIFIISCKTYVYRGEIVYVNEVNSERLVKIYGTDNSIWSTNTSLAIGDVVELETSKKDDIKPKHLHRVCMPLLEHCHIGSGVHNKFHIRPHPTNNTILNYNNRNYHLIVVNDPIKSLDDTTWIITDVDPLVTDSLFLSYLLDGANTEQVIENYWMVTHYTEEEHPGH